VISVSRMETAILQLGSMQFMQIIICVCLHANVGYVKMDYSVYFLDIRANHNLNATSASKKCSYRACNAASSQLISDAPTTPNKDNADSSRRGGRGSPTLTAAPKGILYIQLASLMVITTCGLIVLIFTTAT
jgi:hypothetical protein